MLKSLALKIYKKLFKQSNSKSTLLNNLDEISFLKNLIALTPGNVYWKNRDGFYLGCNNNNAKTFGLKSSNDIIGKKLHELIGGLYAEPIEKVDEQVMSEGKELILEETGPSINGCSATYLSRKIPLFGENQQVVGLIGISFDITERNQMEKELKQAKEIAEQSHKTVRIYLKNILVSLPENFYWMDKDSRILGCNENQAKLFGATSAAELIGKNIYDFAQMAGWSKDVADRIRKNDIEIMTTKQAKKIEEVVYTNGKKRTFISYKNPLLDDNGEVIGVFGVSLDITEQKQLEEELLLAKEKIEIANIIQTEFIRNMEKNGRAPFITGILEFSNQLYQKEADPAKRELLTDIILHTKDLLVSCNED